MIKGVTRERAAVPAVRLVTALRYHSVRAPGDMAAPDDDAACTVSAAQFAEHLDLIEAAGHIVSTIGDLAETHARPGVSPEHGRAVVLTFDRGCTSHLDPVLHMLWERNMPGEFFINPAWVGRRGYLGWNELRGMASAGMSIQSHGYSRRYLDELDGATVADELLRSRKLIEDRIGQPVSVFAAPGGRLNGFIAALAKRVGYRAVCGARPGQWRPHARSTIVPRIPLRAWTTRQELRDWIEDRPFALAAQAGRYHVLRMARLALGNRRYDSLRQRYLNQD